MDACKRVLKKCSKKRDMLILKHSFYVLWYKNNFWNDYDLFDRLSSISSLLQINIFPSMYFLYLFGFFSSYPHSSKKDCGYLSLHFLSYLQNRVLLMTSKYNESLLWVAFQWENLFWFYRYRIIRSCRQRCSMKKGILRNLTKFTGKHLSLFFNKAAGH